MKRCTSSGFGFALEFAFLWADLVGVNSTLTQLARIALAYRRCLKRLRWVASTAWVFVILISRQNNGIIMTERDFWGAKQGHLELGLYPVSKKGGSTTFLGNLFPCLTTPVQALWLLSFTVKLRMLSKERRVRKYLVYYEMWSSCFLFSRSKALYPQQSHVLW